MNGLQNFIFGIYPYIALTVFLLGSLIRFDRDQYSWKSDSSQLLRKGQLRWGSNLFHVGILFLFFGHTFGMLTPHFVYEAFLTAGNKQLLAMISGGLFGLFGFVGVTLLLHRRLSDDRIRANSKTSDIVLLWLLWLQFALGLATVPLSGQHLDGSVMLVLAEWAQRIVTFRGGAAELMAPKWFDKNLALSNDDNFHQLRDVLRLARDAYLADATPDSAFGHFARHHGAVQAAAAARTASMTVSSTSSSSRQRSTGSTLWVLAA